MSAAAWRSYLSAATCALCLGAVLASSACRGPEAAEGEQIVALVNDQPITEADLEQALRREHGPRVLVEMVDEAVIRRQAERAGLTPDPQQVELRLQTALSQLGGNPGLERYLRHNGLTQEQFRERLALGVLLDRLALEQVEVGETQITEYYQAHQERYAYGEQVRARLILCESRENAEALREALLAGGDFAGLAQAFSLDPGTRDQGGDMGYFERDDYAEEISAVAFSLGRGDISPVFAAPDGYCLLKVEDRRSAGYRPLTEVRGEIEALLKYQQLAAVRQQWLVEQRRGAHLTSGDEALRENAERLMEHLPPPGGPGF